MPDLMEILRGAGFEGQSLQTAYAVAMAESGGNARAHNGNAGTGDNSYGLFQINMLGGMGPERRQQYGLSSNDDLFDAEKNARIAYEMSKGGTDWSPWSAYKNGSYKQYLGQSGASVDAGGSLPDLATDVPDAPADITGSATGADFAPANADFAPGQRDFADPVAQQEPEAQAGQQGAAGAYSGGGGSAFRDKLISNALGFLGTRYSWGGGNSRGTSTGVRGSRYDGTGINGLDCSGLLIAAAGLAGYDLPRIAREQLATGQRTSISNLRPGDVIGYGDGYHIALYIGDGKVVDALPGKGVTVRDIGGWEQREGWGVRMSY